jgi:pantetheine-phosphate adenylyltransferase
MKTAIYPGSFDPVTFGHLDIIKRAAKLFDKLFVLVCYNPNKSNCSFTPYERKTMLEIVTNKITNAKTDTHDGLIVDYLIKHSANVIVKGLRAITDFESEFQMALVNKNLCDNAETVFLCSDVRNTFLSSSVVKQVACFGGDISQYVPEELIDYINDRLQIKNSLTGKFSV